jgi:membrane-bound lytic murein transglycosylase MltF
MKRGELRVVTLNSPTSYYLEAQGPEGFEFQLASRFAHELGVKLVMYPVADVRAMQAELAAGRADIAAAQLTLDAGWARVGDATQAYEQIPQRRANRFLAPRGAHRKSTGKNARTTEENGRRQTYLDRNCPELGRSARRCDDR